MSKEKLFQSGSWRGAWLMPVLLLLVSGCGRDQGATDSMDMAQPLMKQAVAKEEEGSYDDAVVLYTRLLELEPRNARGHLGLGLLLEERSKDYVGAIYHYRRYLAIRPETEKLELIDERIDKAKQKFSGSLYNRPNDPGKVISELKTKNDRLKSRIASLKSQVETLSMVAAPGVDLAGVGGARPDAAGDSLTPDQAGTAEVPDAPSPLRVTLPAPYKVRSGDTLESIAIKFYGDRSRWKTILEANHETIRDKNRLQRGQQLTIPKLGG